MQHLPDRKIHLFLLGESLCRVCRPHYSVSCGSTILLVRKTSRLAKRHLMTDRFAQSSGNRMCSKGQLHISGEFYKLLVVFMFVLHPSLIKMPSNSQDKARRGSSTLSSQYQLISPGMPTDPRALTQVSPGFIFVIPLLPSRYSKHTTESTSPTQ